MDQFHPFTAKIYYGAALTTGRPVASEKFALARSIARSLLGSLTDPHWGRAANDSRQSYLGTHIYISGFCYISHNVPVCGR
jgi:hypothetical protein